MRPRLPIQPAIVIKTKSALPAKRCQQSPAQKSKQKFNFQSITFTNGGMHYNLINQRISQKLLTQPLLGPILSSLNNKIPENLSKFIHHKQLSSIYGPEANSQDRDEDIEAIFQLTRFKGGNRLIHKTISYLPDRARFESRWYRALKHLDTPCQLLWGDSDAVAPMDIPKYLATHVIPSKVLTGVYLKNVGHFLMLERPKDWTQLVSKFIHTHQKTA